MSRLKTVICAAALLALCVPAMAINKCTGPDGKVVFQDAGCDTTTKTAEKVKTWDNTPARLNAVEPDLAIVAPPQARTLLELYRRWADAEKLALATGRIALAGPVATMQALQREVESMVPPPCLAAPHKLLAELTKKSTQGLLDFMAKQALDGMVYTVVDRKRLIPAFEVAVKKVKCEP